MELKQLHEVADMIGKSIGIGVRYAILKLIEHHEIASAFSVKFEDISVPIQGGSVDIKGIEVEVTL